MRELTAQEIFKKVEEEICPGNLAMKYLFKCALSRFKRNIDSCSPSGWEDLELEDGDAEIIYNGICVFLQMLASEWACQEDDVTYQYATRIANTLREIFLENLDIEFEDTSTISYSEMMEVAGVITITQDGYGNSVIALTELGEEMMRGSEK